jgi:hypothetical protein
LAERKKRTGRLYGFLSFRILVLDHALANFRIILCKSWLEVEGEGKRNPVHGWWFLHVGASIPCLLDEALPRSNHL